MKMMTDFNPPSQFKAAFLTEAEAPLQIQEKPFDALKHGEVWIQIKASPINPSDLAILAGTYPHQKSYPFVPGLEGTGIVVASGGGFMANFLVGKRVACSAPNADDGTWAEYMKAPAGNCIPLIKKLDFKQGASAIVNPLTALALIDRVKESNSTAFVSTAAAGALGKMLIKLAKQEKLTPINIVRRPEQVNELKNLGAEIVLDSSQPEFNTLLEETSQNFGVQIILDAVGGEFSGTLLGHAPKNSTLVLYASLSREKVQLPPAPIIRFGKKVEGFHLAGWVANQSKIKMIKTTRHAQKLIANGTLASHIHKTFALNQINDAVGSYYNEMSAGKYMLVFP